MKVELEDGKDDRRPPPGTKDLSVRKKKKILVFLSLLPTAAIACRSQVPEARESRVDNEAWRQAAATLAASVVSAARWSAKYV